MKPSTNLGSKSSEPPTYSKDYWDLVFEQLGRNRLFKLAVVVLTLLYASAIYAPLIANDRPYVLEAANYAEYNKALRTLYPATLGVGRIAKQTPEQYLEKRTEGSTQTHEEALQAELGAVRGQLTTMKLYLAPEKHAALEEFDLAIAELIELGGQAGTEPGGEVAELVKAKATETKNLVKAIRVDFKPIDPGAELVEGEQPEGLILTGQRSYPLLEAISGWEMFFMSLWLLVMTWPLWNWIWNLVLLRGDRERIRKNRKRKWLLALALSMLAGLVWGSTLGGSAIFNVSEYKASLTSGEIVETAAVFPLVPYGFAEGHTAEIFRPPTWGESSEISEEGYYVRGARMPEPDPVTGFVSPPKPVEIRFAEPQLNAWNRHLLGTDSAGRDFLVRMLWGGRVSLAVGLVSAILLVIIGTIIGSIAGYFGGWVDMVISRFIEIVICIPAFFLILMTSAFIDPEVLAPIFAIVILIALIRWTGVARLVRGEFLRLRESEFALAAQALGFSSRRTIFLHILPNALAPVLVAGAFAVASGILTESTLSFLGFGIQHPMPSWGSLITDSKMAEHWWVQIFPGVLIFITITCYNQVGDAFRDALDPKAKKQ
jgi:ABC-type dipeptide/oligopeptide/nickel transport system permease subunit